MTQPNLITKFMAWMDLYNNGNKFELLENHLTEKGERCIEAYVPLLNKKVSGVHKNVEKAFDSFFIAFSESIDEYIKDKPYIALALEGQIEIIEEKSREEIKERVDNRKERSVFKKLENDVTYDKFNDILDASVRVIDNVIRAISYLIDEEESNLYINVLSRSLFEAEKSNEVVSAEAQSLCRKELSETNMVLLFTKCRVTDNSVIVIGVTDRL